ncbi:WD40-like Beta Propeller Repeat [Streptomyces sp. DvalAA-14]|uniref:TolB family protein n=1 Tax=unclassified Streptomyces TaxID=2593676 RepID=UPI00081B0DEF|nr:MULTISPECIES: TolB family protein [unclassified Streptomyces]SCD37669.1 WD40-like Beta Propeller Repeat [Streptomyces sp. DvalAA-14]
MTITAAGTNIRPLAPGQRARLLVGDIDGGAPRLVHQTTGSALEAPNWTPDGRWLVFNQDGLLLRIAADATYQGPGAGPAPEVIDTGGITDANNDHVISPDGRTLYLSAGDGHIHAVPLAGGPARRVTNEPRPGPFRHFLHGVSPDGRTLAYVGVEPYGGDEWGYRNIFTLPAAGGPDTRLTDSPAPADGPEFTPDGEWIYFNSEHGATVPGHAQIFRMRPDGSGLTRLTSDERVNWFPHLSPDGRHVLYISFPPGTEGHPADREVVLRLMDPLGAARRDVLAFTGGQGSLNVNSWAPDSRRFAYVDYPADAAG